ncbi:hypothetical protein AUK22_04025 [bacterium CG2_30_54_10]|nr:MAG: hypothetical protein AUK22_04025 [bacterium CG2_30_54_10]
MRAKRGKAIRMPEDCFTSFATTGLHQLKATTFPLNNSGKLNDSWRKRLLPSVGMTASFVIPTECEESRFMLRIS